MNNHFNYNFGWAEGIKKGLLYELFAQPKSVNNKMIEQLKLTISARMLLCLN
jgi:hypothetical protein